MKQALTTLAITTAVTQAKINTHFGLVDSSDGPPMYNADILNKGGETLIAGTTAAGGLGIYYQALLGNSFTETIYRFTSYSFITSPTGSVNFPTKTVIAPNQGFVDTIFATSTDASSRGKVYVYEGEHKFWSQQQILTAPSYSDVLKTYFGSSLAFDQNTAETLYVGCGNCSTLVGKKNGAIYTYKQGKNGAWSQNQEITFTSLYQLANNRIKLDGDLLLTDYQNVATFPSVTPVKSSVLLRKAPNGDFKPEQLLRAPNNKDVDSFDVEDDTIVLGSGGQTVATLSNAGAVYVLAPTTLPPPAPGKPRPVQWSVQQVLYAPTPSGGVKFGTSVALEQDYLAVGDNAASGYIFQRDASVGKWSLQQSLALATGLTTVAKDGQILSATASTISLYDEFQTSHCVVLFLGDHFGDGWDVAQLVVTKPDGSKDYLANKCETPNPYYIRYCPRNLEDKGLYKFSIADASKAKNYWEIIWKVFNENTGDWTSANWDTKLDFEWDSTNARFIGRKVEKPLPSNITCTRCPIKPTDKPTPALRTRHLKDNDNNGGTAHPTQTPAPTLAQTDYLGNQWQKLVLKGSKDWFKADHRSASYYVSDANSHKLVALGTVCNWETKPATCWVDLPDGEYNVRLGGALNENKAALTWNYCKAKTDLASQTQISIKVEDGACDLYVKHDYKSFCGGYDYTGDAALEFIVMGVKSTDEVTASDLSALSQAVAYTFNGVSTSDVRIESATSTGDGGYLVKAVVTFRHSTTGYDSLTMDGVKTLLSDVRTTMTGDGPKTIWSGLQSAEKSSLFHSATSVQFISASLAGSSDVPLVAASSEEVITISDESSVSTDATISSSKSSSSSSEVVSYAGYAVAGVVAAFLVGFFAFGRKGSESSSPVEVPQQEPTIDTSGKRLQLKDLNLNAPSLSDLKQLVKDEDDVLKIMLSRP
mmetsp:Transcript_4382/g.4384  ORF Transcript_4382/g.4384 Transcript_4382/m.4384 type:complete len:932 (-) Transcript_4382:145-2940(-)